MRKLLTLLTLIAGLSAHASSMTCSYQIWLTEDTNSDKIDLDTTVSGITIPYNNEVIADYTGKQSDKEYTVEIEAMKLENGLSVEFFVFTNYERDENGSSGVVVAGTKGLFSNDENDIQLQNFSALGLTNLNCKRKK